MSRPGDEPIITLTTSALFIVPIASLAIPITKSPEATDLPKKSEFSEVRIGFSKILDINKIHDKAK